MLTLPLLLFVNGRIELRSFRRSVLLFGVIEEDDEDDDEEEDDEEDEDNEDWSLLLLFV